MPFTLESFKGLFMVTSSGGGRSMSIEATSMSNFFVKKKLL